MCTRYVRLKNDVGVYPKTVQTDLKSAMSYMRLHMLIELGVVFC